MVFFSIFIKYLNRTIKETEIKSGALKGSAFKFKENLRYKLSFLCYNKPIEIEKGKCKGWIPEYWL